MGKARKKILRWKHFYSGKIQEWVRRQKKATKELHSVEVDEIIPTLGHSKVKVAIANMESSPMAIMSNKKEEFTEAEMIALWAFMDLCNQNSSPTNQPLELSRCMRVIKENRIEEDCSKTNTRCQDTILANEDSN